ncbi:hypothetical protein, partial [Escherichia coli]|uniref:hypothetical protein n=1 Tax=Escherichia coli TaxID=562 RepID=UPI001FCE09D8
TVEEPTVVRDNHRAARELQQGVFQRAQGFDIQVIGWFLDRIATHILDYQDEGKVEFFEGNFTEYEEYKKRTLGADALEPKRIKYKRIAK